MNVRAPPTGTPPHSGRRKRSPIHQAGVLAGSLGIKTAVGQNQEPPVIYLGAGTHAPGAQDAFIQIPGDVRVGIVNWIAVPFSLEAGLSDTAAISIILQPAVAVLFAGQAVRGVIGRSSSMIVFRAS